MYIIQELIDKNTWVDRYQSGDYDFILDLYHGFIAKYPSQKFRVLEVYFYV